MILTGAVRLQRDDKLMYFAFDTAEYRMVSLLQYDKEHAKQPGNVFVSCNVPLTMSEAGEAFVDYEGGMNWAVKACRACRQVKFGMDPNESVCYRGDVPYWVLGKGILLPRKGRAVL